MTKYTLVSMQYSDGSEVRVPVDKVMKDLWSYITGLQRITDELQQRLTAYEGEDMVKYPLPMRDSGKIGWVIVPDKMTKGETRGAIAGVRFFAEQNFPRHAEVFDEVEQAALIADARDGTKDGALRFYLAVASNDTIKVYRQPAYMAQLAGYMWSLPDTVFMVVAAYDYAAALAIGQEVGTEAMQKKVYNYRRGEMWNDPRLVSPRKTEEPS